MITPLDFNPLYDRNVTRRVRQHRIEEKITANDKPHTAANNAARIPEDI